MSENTIMAQVKVPVDLEESVKIPYIIKDKLLMSPGIWNELYYSAEEIHNAFLSTNWDNKEVRSLFSDHEDFLSTEWIGEVINVRESDGGKIMGDLVIVDKPTALKLAYGAKMGISPKVHGRTDETKILNFKFNNFSVVINPAIKTAYINNAQKIIIENDSIALAEEHIGNAGFEEIRREMKLSPEEFYAIPRDPPSESKLPIYDAAHVRNALARFDQMKDVSAEEKQNAMKKIKSAAKKFDIEVSENKKEDKNIMAEEEKQKQVPEKVVNADAAPGEEKQAGPSMESLDKKMDAMMGMMKQIMESYETMMTSVKNAGSYGKEVEEGVVPAAEEEEEEGKKKKKKGEEKPVEQKMAENKPVAEDVSQKLSEKDQVIAELSEKLKITEAKLNEPAREFIVQQGVTFHELSAKETRTQNADLEFIKVLRNAKR